MSKSLRGTYKTQNKHTENYEFISDFCKKWGWGSADILKKFKLKWKGQNQQLGKTTIPAASDDSPEDGPFSRFDPIHPPISNRRRIECIWWIRYSRSGSDAVYFPLFFWRPVQNIDVPEIVKAGFWLVKNKNINIITKTKIHVNVVSYFIKSNQIRFSVSLKC